VEKARKLPTFYDICARVKGHAEQDRPIALLDKRSWRKSGFHGRLSDFPSLTETRGGPMFLHNSLSFAPEVAGKLCLQGLCVRAGKGVPVVVVFSHRSAGCFRRLRKTEFNLIRLVMRLR